MNIDAIKNLSDANLLAYPGKDFAEFARSQATNFADGTRPEVSHNENVIPLFGAEMGQAQLSPVHHAVKLEPVVEIVSDPEVITGFRTTESNYSSRIKYLRDEELGKVA